MEGRRSFPRQPNQKKKKKDISTYSNTDLISWRVFVRVRLVVVSCLVLYSLGLDLGWVGMRRTTAIVSSLTTTSTSTTRYRHVVLKNRIQLSSSRSRRRLSYRHWFSHHASPTTLTLSTAPLPSTLRVGSSSSTLWSHYSSSSSSSSSSASPNYSSNKDRSGFRVQNTTSSSYTSSSSPTTTPTPTFDNFFETVELRLEEMRAETNAKAGTRTTMDDTGRNASTPTTGTGKDVWTGEIGTSPQWLSSSLSSSSMPAFSRKAFAIYRKTLQDVLSNGRFFGSSNRRKNSDITTTAAEEAAAAIAADPDLERAMEYLLYDRRVVPVNLPSLHQSVSSSSSSSSSMSFRQELEAQRRAFVEATNLWEPAVTQEQPSTTTTATFSSSSQSPKKKKTNSKVQQTILRGLSVLGDHCARNRIATPLHVAWEKIKELGVIPREQALNTYIYVLGVSSSVHVVGDVVGAFASSLHQDDDDYDDDVYDYEGDDDYDVYNDGDDNDSESPQSVLSPDDVAGEVATFHDLLYEPTEKSVSLRIKLMVAKGDTEGAESLLDLPVFDSALSSSDGADNLKLRTYFPIFRAHCDRGDCTAALRLFRRMRESPGVRLEAENHVLLLSTLGEHGWFQQHDHDSSADEERAGALVNTALESMGLPPTGPQLFDRLAQDMADDVLEITSASARRLSHSLSGTRKPQPSGDLQGNNNNNNNNNNNDDDEDDDNAYDPDFLLKALPTLAAMPRTNDRASDDEMVLSRIVLDEETGTCPRTGARLRLIRLNDTDKTSFRDSLLKMSSDNYEDFSAAQNRYNNHTKVNVNGEYAIEQLNKFAHWLDTREGEPFTAILDGANIAYYGQNFEQGKFNYHQIQFLVDALESKDEHVLVIIPHKYSLDSYYSSVGSYGNNKYQKNILTKEERAIVQGLNETGKLYVVSSSCLDDYYWMLASVSDQTVARKGRDLTVHAAVVPEDDDDDDDGTTHPSSSSSHSPRWPGARPMLLTNDRMRDHRLELMAPRQFRRWTTSHIVNYNFSAFVDSECASWEIGFSQPDFFSREIQGNPVTASSTASTPLAWHFPVGDWEPNERFCVRYPVTKTPTTATATTTPQSSSNSKL